MKKRPFAILSIAVFMGVLFTLGATASFAAPEFTLKYQNAFGTSSLTWTVSNAFCDKLEELSGGRIKIDRFPSSQLVPIKETLSALKRGIIDMSLSAGSYYAGIVPCADVFFIPFIFKGQDDVYGLYNDTEWGKIFKQAYLDYGVVHVAPIFEYTEFLVMREGKDAKSVHDLKGKLIRAAGGNIIEFLKLIGAKPVQLPSSETYTALQRGTVDGVVNATYLYNVYKYYEVTGSVVTDPPLVDPLVVDIYMSKKTYDKLPKDLQKCVDEAGLYIQKAAPKIFWPAIKKVMDYIKDHNIKDYKWSEADRKFCTEKALIVLDKWAKESPANEKLAKIIKDRLAK